MTNHLSVMTKEKVSMKKSLMIVALAMVLVFAFSGVAYAKITNGYVSWATASAPNSERSRSWLGSCVLARWNGAGSSRLSKPS